MHFMSGGIAPPVLDYFLIPFYFLCNKLSFSNFLSVVNMDYFCTLFKNEICKECKDVNPLHLVFGQLTAVSVVPKSSAWLNDFKHFI